MRAAEGTVEGERAGDGEDGNPIFVLLLVAIRGRGLRLGERWDDDEGSPRSVFSESWRAQTSEQNQAESVESGRPQKQSSGVDMGRSAQAERTRASKEREERDENSHTLTGGEAAGPA